MITKEEINFSVLTEELEYGIESIFGSIYDSNYDDEDIYDGDRYDLILDDLSYSEELVIKVLDKETIIREVNAHCTEWFELLEIIPETEYGTIFILKIKK